MKHRGHGSSVIRRLSTHISSSLDLHEDFVSRDTLAEWLAKRAFFLSRLIRVGSNPPGVLIRQSSHESKQLQVI